MKKQQSAVQFFVLALAAVAFDVSAQIIRIENGPAPAIVREDIGEIRLLLLRQGDATGFTSLRYAVEGPPTGCAAVGPASGTLEWMPGQTEKELTLPVSDDAVLNEIQGWMGSVAISCGFSVVFSDARGGALWDSTMPSERIRQACWPFLALPFVAVRSDALGELVLWAPDDSTKAKLCDLGAPWKAVYTKAELARLVESQVTPDQLRAVHSARKTFGGRVTQATS